MGKPVYNFSFNGASPEFNSAFYRDYLKKYYRDSEYIIYALSPGSFRKIWREIEDDVKYIPIPVNNSDFKPLLFNYKDIKIFRTGTIAEALVKSYARNNPVGIRRGIDMRGFNNGFVTYDTGLKYILHRQPLIIDMNQFSSLHKLLAEVKSDGVKIILVTLPAPFGQYPDVDLVKFNRLVDELGEAYNAPVLKAEAVAPEIGKNIDLFNDDVHLKLKGAMIYSEKLSIKLREFIY